MSRSVTWRLAQALLGALIHVGTWVVFQWGVMYLASGAPSRVAYGMMAAWWATLYIGYVMSVRLRTLPVIVLASALWVGLTIWSPWREVYREPGEIITTGRFLYEVAWGVLIYGSPIIVNAGVRHLHDRLRRSGSSVPST